MVQAVSSRRVPRQCRREGPVQKGEEGQEGTEAEVVEERAVKMSDNDMDATP